MKLLDHSFANIILYNQYTTIKILEYIKYALIYTTLVIVFLFYNKSPVFIPISHSYHLEQYSYHTVRKKLLIVIYFYVNQSFLALLWK